MSPVIDKMLALAALQEFDSKLRGMAEWSDWEANKAHKYAISYEGKQYPVKQIVAMASGVPVGEFSGGKATGQANAVIAAAGFKVVPLRESNPDWTRDELILALNLYLKHRPNPPAVGSKEIIDLSKVLQQLGMKLFPASERADSFRNANGVSMKMMNFRRLDPAYTSGGKKGLTRGAKGEEDVWKEFANDPVQCQAVSDAIIAALDDPEVGGQKLILLLVLRRPQKVGCLPASTSPVSATVSWLKLSASKP